MTIGIGVVCDGGVVLGTDLQYTIDSTKTPGQKMFPICIDMPYSILIAASGDPDSAKQVAALAESIIFDGYRSVMPTFAQVRDCIEQALRTVYFDHIDRAPVRERALMRCDLLVAVRIGIESQLYYSNRTRLIQERYTKCVGIGLYFSNYALGSLLPDTPLMQVAAQVVAYVIGMASEYVEGVGKGADIHLIHEDGRHTSLLKPEREEIESDFGGLFDCFRGVVSTIDPAFSSNESFTMHLDFLREAAIRLRTAQNVRAHASEMRRARAEAIRLNRQSTKADPSHQQPSPESHGGSDGS